MSGQLRVRDRLFIFFVIFLLKFEATQLLPFVIDEARKHFDWKPVEVEPYVDSFVVLSVESLRPQFLTGWEIFPFDDEALLAAYLTLHATKTDGQVQFAEWSNENKIKR